MQTSTSIVFCGIQITSAFHKRLHCTQVSVASRLCNSQHNKIMVGNTDPMQSCALIGILQFGVHFGSQQQLYTLHCAFRCCPMQSSSSATIRNMNVNAGGSQKLL